MNPHTFLKALGPEPWRCAYVEPSRRPTDGRYGDNPNRLQHYFQYQVLLKPSLLKFRTCTWIVCGLGIDPCSMTPGLWKITGIPTLGAWGLGWEVWVDGMEVTQFTYFQQCGGFDCRPVSAELTYGLERSPCLFKRWTAFFTSSGQETIPTRISTTNWKWIIPVIILKRRTLRCFFAFSTCMKRVFKIGGNRSQPTGL